MSTRTAEVLLACALLAGASLAGASRASAQPATLSNAELQPHSAAAGLQATIDGLRPSLPGAAWIGWQAPARGDAEMCCWTDSGGERCAGCTLDGSHLGFTRSGTILDRDASRVRLEAEPRLVVLLHLESGKTDRVRVFSAECPIDAGGAIVHWLRDVKPADSVAVLATLVPDKDSSRPARRVGDGALAAIAHHADPAAMTALERLVAPGRLPWVRKQAAFWMGQTGGDRALDALIRLAGQDADERFREHLAFVLSQSRQDRALEALIGMAKRDASRKVRGQALFWLGQKAEKKALAAIEDAIREDPDTEIKKKAVFALSQLPRDEGVPLLIRTARSHSNPEVRKQAMFWLGQSEDPRALAFFEEVLTK